MSNSHIKTTKTTTTTRRSYGDSSQPSTNNSTPVRDGASAARTQLEMNSLQRQIDELDKQLDIAETEESHNLDKVVEDVKENTRRQIHRGTEDMASDFKIMCQNQLDNLKKREEEHTAQTRESLKQYQDNIFKTNRVFREVSRFLRDDWQPLFKILMAKFPQDRVEQEILILEGEKPIMQPYKALVRWKEMVGQDFSIDKLIQTLQESALFDAAQKAREVVFSSDGGYISDLSTVKPLPRAQSNRVEEILASVANRTSSNSNGEESITEVTISSGPSWATMNTGPINNSKLLRLSKKLGGQWKDLGRSLGVSDEEMESVQELMDGDAQQCAFQTLYKWRDGVTGSDVSNAEDLAKALKQMGKHDLAKDFES